HRRRDRRIRRHRRRTSGDAGALYQRQGGDGAPPRHDRWASPPGGEGVSGQAQPKGNRRPSLSSSTTTHVNLPKTAPIAAAVERDLAHALAKRFDLGSVVVVPVGFAALVGGDLNGADLALSELTPTGEREKVLDFSTPYLVAPPSVVVRPGGAVRDLAAL